MDGTPQNGPEDQDRGETYTPIEAGRVLGVSDERVRQLVEAGEIEGEKRAGRWHVYRMSVHHQLEQRGSPRARRSRERAPHESGEDAARELRARVEDLSYKLGRSEARAELTERAESTMREALERERERADRLEAEARQLREAALEASRRGFWSRLFGS
jgi:hypothetical protein